MMANKGVKTQKQVQFLCPKLNHLSVDEKFSMRTPKVTKKFRFLYNKGVVASASAADAETNAVTLDNSPILASL